MIDRKVFPQLPLLRPRPDLPTRGGRMVLEVMQDFHAQLTDARWSIVPAGYLSDGASKPLLACLFGGGPASRPYLLAAIVHDWHCDLYRRGWTDRLAYLNTDATPNAWTQAQRQSHRRLSARQVHDNFAFHCRAVGEPRWRATYMHWAAHLFCSKNWRFW